MRARTIIVAVLLIGVFLVALSYIGGIHLIGGPSALMAGENEGIACKGDAPADFCDGNVAKYNATCIGGEWVFQEDKCFIKCENARCVAYKCATDCSDGDDSTADVCNIFNGKCEHYTKVRAEGQATEAAGIKAPGGVLIFQQGADNSLIYGDYFRLELLKVYRHLGTIADDTDYFVIELSAQNLNNSEQEFRPQMTLADGSGIEHPQLARCGKDGGEIKTGNLDPGEKVAGKVCFGSDVHNSFPLRLYVGKWYDYVLITDDFVRIERSKRTTTDHRGGGSSGASTSTADTGDTSDAGENWLPPADDSGTDNGGGEVVPITPEPSDSEGEQWLPEAE
ncbi:Uncharacterised protein [Candidatus Gugararchaeum adminiculabundum]|nr:Uncharacterised protein [Candidatus Gugararchaeum adminiculabundum]